MTGDYSDGDYFEERRKRGDFPMPPEQPNALEAVLDHIDATGAFPIGGTDAETLVEAARAYLAAEERLRELEEALRGLMVVVETVGYTGHRSVDNVLSMRVEKARAALAKEETPT